MDIKAALNKIASRQDLTGEEMRAVMSTIMEGNATPSQIGAFLMGMRVKGETVGEIAAAVSILREKMVQVQVAEPENTIDIVGTGGDGAETLNISTASAFVTAASGVPVAKHGNRALSSKSGASDVLTALGVKLDLTPEKISQCVAKAGIGFMFAPAHHPAMKHVGPSRVEMGTRTLFNLLGPQSNPAGARRYMLGVYDQRWVEPVAAALLANRAVSAWVVHGADNLDELSTTGTSFVAQIKNGDLRSFSLDPEDAGLARANLADLKGADPAYNAGRMRALFDGQRDAYRDIVLYNTAAALVVADKAPDLKSGVALAADSIDSGRARAKLDALIAVSNS
jgi:anthranilate phosphoribosyltransferase